MVSGIFTKNIHRSLISNTAEVYWSLQQITCDRSDRWTDRLLFFINTKKIKRQHFFCKTIINIIGLFRTFEVYYHAYTIIEKNMIIKL